MYSKYCITKIRNSKKDWIYSRGVDGRNSVKVSYIELTKKNIESSKFKALKISSKVIKDLNGKIQNWQFFQICPRLKNKFIIPLKIWSEANLDNDS